MIKHLRTISKHLKIFACYFRLNLASALEYRASFISQAFGMALSNSSFLFFWWVIFPQIGGAVAGYSFEDILFIWAVTSSGFGISHVLFENARDLTRLIVTGELDAFILQPCSILANVLCAKTSLSAYGDFFYGFVLMLIFFPGDPSAWLWFLYGVLTCGVLMTAINLVSHSLSFYWGEASSIGRMAREFMLNFSLYPEKMYAPVMRGLMYSIIPAGIAVHVPLRLFRDFSLWAALVALGGAVLYCVAVGLFFYRGLRRYESGNVIVTRL
jgi:ABC-2 type transport system permease protein